MTYKFANVKTEMLKPKHTLVKNLNYFNMVTKNIEGGAIKVLKSSISQIKQLSRNVLDKSCLVLRGDFGLILIGIFTIMF